ncbi:MAG: hypothetical protein ACK4TO_08785 [Candidatus Nitrosotenuis sp.]
MTIYDEYIKGILQQIDDVYTLFSNLKDKPGDLDIIKRELAKVTGLFQVLTNKLEANTEFADYEFLLLPTKYFLQNHDFFREIDTMSLLYSEDPLRLKNLRLIILDALNEKNLIGHIKAILQDKS